jgi:hypothetical protein
MVIHINSKHKLSSLQKEFSSFFPFLKLEFFRKKHNDMEGSAKRYLVSHDTSLSELLNTETLAQYSFSAETTVSTIEQDLEAQFGLHAQVFRKSGNVWIETTLTDSWTLAHQNEEGQELSSKSNDESAADMADRDVWR